MKKIARILALLAAAATLGLGMASCDYWDSDWYKEGGGSGNSAASSGGSGNSTAPSASTSSGSGGSGSPSSTTPTPSSGSDVIPFSFDEHGALIMTGEVATSFGFASSEDIPHATVTAIKPASAPPANGVAKYCLGFWDQDEAMLVIYTIKTMEERLFLFLLVLVKR